MSKGEPRKPLARGAVDSGWIVEVSSCNVLLHRSSLVTGCKVEGKIHFPTAANKSRGEKSIEGPGLQIISMIVKVTSLKALI